MSFISSPKLLFGLRIVQLVFALVFLVLLAYTNQNPGDWINLVGPVALGVVTFVFTLGIAGFGIWQHFKKGASSHSRVFRIALVAVQGLVFLMWIGTATLMLRPKDLAPIVHIPLIEPWASWDTAIACTFVEIITFLIAPVVEFLQGRSKLGPRNMA